MNISKLVTGVVIGLCFSVSADAEAKNFQHTWSGWGMNSQEADLNGDMTGGIVGDWSGKGTFGRADNHSVLDSVFSGFCDTEEGPGTGFLLVYTTHTNVFRSRSGDLLYRTVSSSPPSTACVDVVNGKVDVEVHLDVIGGTGKFKDATGSTVFKYKVQILPGQNGLFGRERGRIFGMNDDKGEND